VSDQLELQLAWQAVAGRGTDRRRAESVFDDIVSRHRQPHRRYHGLRHLVWMVRHVHELAEPAGPIDVPVALAAAFFHDAIYEPAADDNEERSAQLATNQLGAIGWSDNDVELASTCVLATAGHFDDPDAGDDSAAARCRAVVLDADLAVLGADPAAYQAYATGVRAEYSHIDESTWRVRRSAVLQRLLARDRLYLTAAARGWWEDRARANLVAELSSLVP
jgi:predicted metal-dependent HD superfamily phosphohydrolase